MRFIRAMAVPLGIVMCDRPEIKDGEESEVVNATETISHNPTTVGASKTCLLIIDMQRDFVDDNGRLKIPEIDPNLFVNIDTLIAQGGWKSVVFTMDAHPEDHISFVRFGELQFTKRSLSYNVDGIKQKLDTVSKPEGVGKLADHVSHTPAIDLCGTIVETDEASIVRGLVNMKQPIFNSHCVVGNLGQLFSERLAKYPDLALVENKLQYDDDFPGRPLLTPESIKSNPNFYVFTKGLSATIDAFGAFETVLDGKVLLGIDRKGENGLHQFLQSNGIKELVVAGVAGDFCVKATAIQATARGYTTTVVSDAIEYFVRGDKSWADKEMKDNDVTFKTTEEILETLIE